ncbi:two-component SAPR family response regulator [Paenibacillus endophyticus]|uniref:Two-component SAPR family response regulator n=1 Tax=Paenibacillus endophyticus TaxID=1294268 RepID=A0A7W5C9B4_9BACL|nr:BTAD domain-containing putative transcriptional regulator [Paenibacillus endophyticus]MBB3153526.1 two-component SAPR family response regulator [Paenibacillus endophyticus]
MDDNQSKIRCFGHFMLLDPSGEAVKWRTSKAEELMAYLVHHRGEAVERTRIMDALWGNDAAKTPAYFNTTAHYLRNNLLNIGLVDILQHSKGKYRIRVDSFEVDSLVFERWQPSCKTIHSGNLTECEDTVKLYTGSYLANKDYSWTEQRRASYENKYLELVIGINDYYVNEGTYSTSIKFLKKAIKQVPWNETIHNLLIRSHLEDHDRLAALKQYDALKRMLRREYREDPSDEIKRLMHLRN